jgi:hypothetical protein
MVVAKCRLEGSAILKICLFACGFASEEARGAVIPKDERERRGSFLRPLSRSAMRS